MSTKQASYLEASTFTRTTQRYRHESFPSTYFFNTLIVVKEHNATPPNQSVGKILLRIPHTHMLTRSVSSVTLYSAHY